MGLVTHWFRGFFQTIILIKIGENDKINIFKHTVIAKNLPLVNQKLGLVERSLKKHIGCVRNKTLPLLSQNYFRELKKS